MRALSAHQLLDLWEEGHVAPPIERAMSLLAAASPDATRESLEQLSIGSRDAKLLQLREWVFGSELTMTAACPSCGQTLEMTVSTPALMIPTLTEGSEQQFELDGYSVSFRPPNTKDLAACSGLGMAQSRRALIERCIREASRYGQAVPLGQLPSGVLNEVEDRIAAMDSQADVVLDFDCPECHQKWKQRFDIVSFFWTEIDAWARRVLLEVNVLARTFGWRENDILAMSPARRQIYIAMAQA